MKIKSLKIKNKKGIFFTVTVIIIMSLFLLNFTFFSDIKERKTTQNRIKSLDNFVFSVDEDLPRQFGISTFRIVFLLERKVIESGTYLTNFTEAFGETFYNGTVLGTTNPTIESLMEGATFPDIVESIQNRAAKIGANVTITNSRINISQDNPWEIKLIVEAEITIKDLNNLAIWNKTVNITSFTPIDNLEDPVYFVETGGKATNKIFKQTNLTFVNGSDITILENHALNSTYIASSEAPSFIQRLEGNLSAHSQGIESLVNLQHLSSLGISVDDKSVVDHIYFSNSNPSACNTAPSGMPGWFKLDDNHIDTYNVSCV